MRTPLLALALAFLAVHLACTPPTFEDIDAVNFALGVRDFDVAAHQPHPPGYPAYIALAKASTGVLNLLRIPAAEVRGLSVLNGLAGALAIPLLFLLFRRLLDDEEVAAGGAVLATFAPLAWFTALRPLSDTTGYVAALAAQLPLAWAATARAPNGTAGIALVVGAALAGFSIGVRSQNFTLTLPLLALALLMRGTDITWRHRLAALAAAVAAALLWALPLLALSGGLEGYLLALGDQAGEDFTGAVMLWTTRTPRALLNALQYTFLWPWGCPVAGAIVVAVATVGAIRLLLRNREALLVLLVGFGPYAAFHLVFQETVMTRYALPLVPAVGILAVYGLGIGGRWTVRLGTAAAIVAALVIVARPTWVFATEESPGARIVKDAVGLEGASLVGMHAVMLRFDGWYRPAGAREGVRARHGQEVLSLVDRWREAPSTTVAFMADRNRTDLEMLDPRARILRESYDWPFPEMPLMGGARPAALDLYLLRPPAWMLDRGWAVTAEVAGESFRAGARPEIRPSIAWVRSRDEALTLMIGGRHLVAGGPPARIIMTTPSETLESFDVQPGFFFRTFTVPAGAFRSLDAYVPLSVEASAPYGGDVQASLEQFDLQPAGVPMVGFREGWQEPEYNRLSGRAWRWMAARGVVWVRPVGGDVTLTLEAESPLRYFDAPPVLRVRIGGEEVGTLTPSADFEWQVRLPSAALAAADGEVVIESDRWFVPGAEGSGDQRQLALRVYRVRVD